MGYKYTVELRTANIDGAGTNADVDIQIKGQSATSQWFTLDNPGDDRERGSWNRYVLFNSTHLGSINGITLRVKKADEDRPDWCLESVLLVDHDAPNGAVTYEYLKGNEAVWINPTSNTEWVYWSPESVGTSTSPLTISPSLELQDGWRWCKKCQGMFFTIDSKGICPQGGVHDGSGSSRYTLAHNDANAPGQNNWRWCSKCQGLFFGNPGSRCPAGSEHSSSGSGNYTLSHNDANAPGQNNWRWCSKCQGLFFIGRNKGVCPKGGQHNDSGSGEYKIEMH